MSFKHDRWTDAMLATLAPDEPALAAGEVRHRVVMRPAFMEELLISARFGAAPSLRLAATVRPTTEEDPPVIHEEEVALAPATAEALRGALEVSGLDAPDDRRGLDGITIISEFTEGDAPPRRLSWWSPEPGMAAHSYMAALHAAATAALREELSHQTLERVFVYLALGLPARDHGGSPRRLQIFGRLSSSQEAQLERLFAAVAADEAVVVDMRNFGGMGTLLHPVFRRFSRRAGPTAWAVSKPARQHLEEARVPGQQLFDDLEGALRSVGAGGH